MSKVDGRKVPHEVREAIRIEAIEKWLDGATVKSLSDEHGTDESCIYRWIDRYREGGMEALKTRPIAHSKNAKLSPEQRETLTQIILTKDQTSYGYTRYPALRKLAEEKKAVIYFIDET